MLVADVMTTEPVTVGPATTIREAIGLLARHGITALPVVGHDGRVVGVVSEADLIRDTVPADPRARLSPVPGTTLPPRHVDEVLTRQVLTARPHDDLLAAVDLMTSTGVKSLPVVDDGGRLVGIVARSDVVRMLARSDRAIETDLDETFRSLGHADWLVTAEDGIVVVTGPRGPAERSLADVVARTIAGVTSVHVV